MNSIFTNNPMFDPKNNPFFNSNFSRLFSDLYLQKWSDWSIEEMLRNQANTVEAMIAANQAVLDGVNQVLALQNRNLKDVVSEGTDLASRATGSADVQVSLTEAVELLQKNLRNVLALMQETQQVLNKGNTKALEIVSKQVSDNLSALSSKKEKKATSATTGGK